jgi:AraC-like DNA-binding protein/mannose-6-phosphate isomerase-like protein (cupin superfamily)
MNSHPIYYYRDFMEESFPFKLEFPNEQRLNQSLHAHEHLQICFVMNGACLHHVKEQAYLLVKGDMFVIPPFVPHRLEPYHEEKVEVVQIDFMPIVVNEDEILREAPFFPKFSISSGNQAQIQGLIAHMKEEHARRESGYEQLIKADLIRLLVTIFRETSKLDAAASVNEPPSRRLFYESVQYIEEHYAEELHLNELAQRAAMSPTYFSYMFKVLKGQPFVQYVNEIRIRKALDLLRLTEKSVMEICMETGFNNMSHFNRMFKKATGTSPLKYRQQGNES